MNILIVEPYYGGSHRSFVDVLLKHSEHHIEAETMPPRFWKWRLSGAPFILADRFRKKKLKPDFLVFSNTIDVAAFTALAGVEALELPKLVYFHENQIVYPLSEHDTPDVHYGLINIVSALSANEVWFNSNFHRLTFLDALEPFLHQFPDFVPKDLDKELIDRTDVLPMPIEPLPKVEPAKEKGKSLRILWNHRWEYDKGPDMFFAALERLLTEGIDFEVVILGEGFQNTPLVFERSRDLLKDRILRYGYAKSRESYAAWVRSCDVVVSCARQEYFGVSVAEAVMAGCFPILPNSLVYPDFIPEEKHKDHLYTEPEELVAMLRNASRNLDQIRAAEPFQYYDEFLAPKIAETFDKRITRMIADNGNH